MKQCFKCNITKPLSEFYRHSQMKDGHLNKCKLCARLDTKNLQNELLKNPEWREKDKSRHREKYYRLKYKEKHKPTPEKKKQIMDRYKNKYPEKCKARSLSDHLKINGFQIHHWSYNIEHAKDIIQLPPSDHYKLHRHIIYDQETKMYRRKDTMELLNTKDLHLEYFNIIKNKD